MRFVIPRQRIFCFTSLLMIAFLVSGCGLLFGSGPEPTPTVVEQRALVPTFTPTTAPPPEPPTATPTPLPPAPTAVLTTTQPVTNTQVTTQTTQAITQTTAPITKTQPVTSTTAPKAKLLISTDIANARLGPGTDYGLGGTATKDQEFEITGKTQAGDWWQVCCVNGQEVWIFGELAQVQNTETVPVITNLPPKPVLVAATPAPAAPAPTPTPAPQQVQAPAAPDPCAGIGGDGCKFKLRNGPKFAPNGGGELKLQLAFIHSGIEGGQAQGSYFVALFKDGQKLPIPDSVRSIALTKQQGALGQYNYEFKLGTGNIPGNNVAGNYVIHVLDGNGERDSKDFAFTVPDGQGEVWMEFDQG